MKLSINYLATSVDVLNNKIASSIIIERVTVNLVIPVVIFMNRVHAVSLLLRPMIEVSLERIPPLLSSTSNRRQCHLWFVNVPSRTRTPPTNRYWLTSALQSRALSFRNGRIGQNRDRNRGSNNSKRQRPTTAKVEATIPPKSDTNTTSTTTAQTGNGTNNSTTNNLTRWWSQWRDNFNKSNEPFWMMRLRRLVPVRYRFPRDQSSQYYSYEQGILIAKRLVLWTAIALVLIVYDETAPFELVGIRGPSMIPTMAADGSDLWLCRTYASWWRCYWEATTNSVVLWFIQPRFKRGDIIGFAHPDSPNSAISCKRIVGLPGDRVQRYGQYVHLYIDQDPEGWGVTWPATADPNHAWITTQGTTWDTPVLENPSPAVKELSNAKLEAVRTIVVPDGHVWIEADCPALGLDSRQFGPIPFSWIRTRAIAKVWPLQSSPFYKKWHHRPHPIPLDIETLMEYNVFHQRKAAKQEYE
jgi:signal peptidase I